MHLLYPVVSLFLYVSTFTFQGQESKSFISGYIKNITDNSPVAYANIFLKSNSQQGTISNMEGNFKLLIPNKFIHDTLVISFIGYETQKIYLSNHNLEDSIFVFLNEAEFVLNDILVLGTTPLTFLKEAAKITSESCVSPAVLSAYYREFISKNDQFTQYADAMVDYYVEYRGSKSSKIHVRLLESRAKKVEVKIETPASGGDFNVSQQLDIESLANAFNAHRHLTAVLSFGDDGNHYDFELYEITNNGKEFFKVIFTPKEEIEKMLFNGTFLIDKETSIIQSVTYIIPDSHKKYGKVYKLPFGSRVQQAAAEYYIQYQPIGDRFHVKYAKAKVNLHVFDKKGTDIMHSFSNEMLVHTVDYQNPMIFDGKERWRKKSIVKHGTNYNTRFWEGQQVLMATETEEKIIQSLDKKSQ